MSDDHGWFGDHHDGDGGDHHEDPAFDPGQDASHDDAPLFDHEDHDFSAVSFDDDADHHDAGHEIVEPPELDDHDHHDDSIAEVVEHQVHTLLGPVGTDPDATAEPDLTLAGDFPDPVDVGPLPEPVDGFPWIDVSALGSAVTEAGHMIAVSAQDLADYAGEANADWQALTNSEDPATSALANFWKDEN
jgi:hypothetical protein